MRHRIRRQSGEPVTESTHAPLTLPRAEDAEFGTCVQVGSTNRRAHRPMREELAATREHLRRCTNVHIMFGDTEWDPLKAALNPSKHGVAFTEAVNERRSYEEGDNA